MKIVSWLWIPFVIGLIAHVLGEAWEAVKAPSNGVKTVPQYLALTWPLSLVRSLCSAACMAGWLEMPDVFSKLVSTVTGGIWVSLPLNFATAYIFGYIVDSWLNKAQTIAGFAIDLPTVAPPSAFQPKEKTQ